MKFFILGFIIGAIIIFGLFSFMSAVGKINKEREAYEEGYNSGYEKGVRESKGEYMRGIQDGMGIEKSDYPRE